MAASSSPDRGDETVAWRFGEFELDGARRTVTRSGRRLRLSARAFDVLDGAANRLARIQFPEAFTIRLPDPAEKQ